MSVERDEPLMSLRKDSGGASFTSVVVGFLATCASILLALALNNLMVETGTGSRLKMMILAVGAGVVSFSINKIAIEKGARLAAIGFTSAGVASLFAINIVGLGLFTSTYAGLTIHSVGQLQLVQHGNRLSHRVADRNRMATEARRVEPVVKMIAADLTRYADCEVRNSCVSKRGTGGRGPVALFLEDLAGQAAGIGEALQDGEAARITALQRLNDLVGRFQSVLDEDGMAYRDKRTELQRVDAEIAQAVSALDEAIPLTLLQAYAGELAGGVTVDGRPVATRNLNAILKKHADTLQAVLKTIERDDAAPLAFPAPPGVSDTLVYIGHFVPVAAIAFVLECVFPTTLWIYTFLTLWWRIYQVEGPRPKRERQDDFAGLIDLPPRHPERQGPPQKRSDTAHDQSARRNRRRRS
ncbi:MAG: hypothetical protein ROR55_02950 [Devosia sp.]